MLMLSEMEKNKQLLIETLMKGIDSAKKLQSLRRRSVSSDGSGSVDDLLIEIRESFSGGLSIMKSWDSGEICGSPGSSHGVEMPEVLVYSGKKPATVAKEKRGGYKRRRTSDSRAKISDTIEDAYGWRKYGQKDILNFTSPRCYFRCTHKLLQGCNAKKQVQKLEDGSNMFHITYFGHHTCFTTPNTFLDQGVVLDFSNSKNHPHFSNNPSTITNDQTEPSIKQEVESKPQTIDLCDNIPSSALGWNEVFMNDLGTPFMEFGKEDSCASTNSHSYLNMDFLDNGDFLGDIQLDEVVFPRLH